MRIWLRWVGLTVVCVAAVVASFSTLASLAEFTGWDPAASWLLPLALDALGMTACLVWLDATAPKKARRYAAWMTWIAAGLSVLGNGAGHLASTGHLQQGLLLVLLVGSVPPAALAVTVHLIVSVSAAAAKPARPVRDAAPVPATALWILKVPQKRVAPGPAKPTAKPKATKAPSPVKSEPESDETGPDEVLIRRARHLDEQYKQEHGKPIPRDKARPLLGVSNALTGKALEIARKEGVA